MLKKSNWRYPVLLIFFCWIFLHQIAKAQDAGLRNGFLFEIEKSGHISYLLGTIHTGFTPNQNIGGNILDALQKSRRLYVEADISNQKAVDQKIEANGFTRQPTLKSIIGTEYYEFYRKVFVDRAHFFSEDEFSRAKPWLITIVMPVFDPLQDDPPHLQFGSEVQLAAFANTHGIPVEELEGLQAQLNAFDTGTSTGPSAVFNAYVNLVKRRVIYQILRDEVVAWTVGDLSALERVVAQRRALDDPYSRFYNTSILSERNIYFASKISAICTKEDSIFFAVGSEHLVGPNGVLKRLSEKGFEVRRLR